MKGVLLCGGEGTRLRPLTEVVNKHLIRVGNKPMAEYPLESMVQAGIRDILIVSGGENFAAVVKYFGSGAKWRINITHAIQDQPGGIAQAVGMARGFVGYDKFLVCLGDNLWSMNIRDAVKTFETYSSNTREALLFSIESKTPERFGVLKYNKEGRPYDVIEKPKRKVSNTILTGIYGYNGVDVFELIKNLKPSARGELEISDINRHYLRYDLAKITAMTGWWSDCGTLETLKQAEEHLKNDRAI